MNTPKTEYSTEKTLYMAMELSQDKWKLGFSTGMGREPRLRNVEARDLLGLEEEIQKLLPYSIMVIPKLGQVLL